MRRLAAFSLCLLVLSSCDSGDKPEAEALPYAINRCAFSVSGVPTLSDGEDVNRTYIDEAPRLYRPGSINTVPPLTLECNATTESGRRVTVSLAGFENESGLTILDSSLRASWGVIVSDGGNILERHQDGPGGESGGSITVESAASLASVEGGRNLNASFNFTVVDYEGGGEGTYVSVEGTTQ